MTNSRINLWLQLEPNYIDSNFERVLEYMRQCDIRSCDDSFHKETMELIEKRVEAEMESISNEHVFSHLGMSGKALCA